MANKTKTEKYYVKRQEFYDNIVIYLDKKKKMLDIIKNENL